MRALPTEAQQALAARHLFQHLGFTTHFETEVVNRATQRIATGRGGVDTPARTRLDAFRIYCDEGLPRAVQLDVVRQIADASGVEPVPYDFAPFRERLDAVGVEGTAGAAGAGPASPGRRVRDAGHPPSSARCPRTSAC
ncbi:hypothetical protein LT493_08945 [Streptomyces tricolor]|nr:hypothetical protein [Streptomyces tricolor]